MTDTDQDLSKDGTYYSQYGQDKYFDQQIFKGKRNGVFCDVGAHDGITISNTYYFEKVLGWTGVCIEAQPKEHKKLSKNRSCSCVYGAAYNRSGNIQFRDNSGHTNMLSGIEETYSVEHRQRLFRELQQQGGDSHIITVPCFTLTEIFENHNMNHIDLLSIDTEGSEYQILQGIDFSKVHINAITIEINYPNSEEHNNIRKLLSSNGFYPVAFMCGDEIWLNTKL